MEQLNYTVVTSNISSSSGNSSHLSWHPTGLGPATVMSFCFLLGVPGNIAVIVLKPNWQHLSSVTQGLMLNLAVTDLLCLLSLPLWIYTYLYSWTFSLVACKLLAYLVYCTIHESILTITVLSIQRYLLVVHPQRFSQQVGTRKLLVLLWLVAMILSIPMLVVRQLIPNQQGTHCQRHYSSEAQWMAMLLTENLEVLTLFSVVAFAYISLHRKVHQGAFFNNPQTTRLVTSIIVTFFVLWVPYFIINVLGVAAISLKNEGLLKFFTVTSPIVGSLTFVNSCLNPLLYAFASHNMYSVFKKTQQFMQKLRIPQILSKSLDIATDAERQ